MTTPRPGRVRVSPTTLGFWRWYCGGCGAWKYVALPLLTDVTATAHAHARTCPAIRAHAAEAIIRDAHRIACSTGADAAVIETLERAWGVASCE